MGSGGGGMFAKVAEATQFFLSRGFNFRVFLGFFPSFITPFILFYFCAILYPICCFIYPALGSFNRATLNIQSAR